MDIKKTELYKVDMKLYMLHGYVLSPEYTKEGCITRIAELIELVRVERDREQELRDLMFKLANSL